MFEPLNLPPYAFKIKEDEQRHYIFDELRKKYLLLTPEEWVRQHFVQYLIKHKNFSSSLISLEQGMKLNELQKRTDILVYNNTGAVVMLVECKAPNVKINQDVFDQASRYNIKHKVNYIVVTNGLSHYCCKIDYELLSTTFLNDIPNSEELNIAP